MGGPKASELENREKKPTRCTKYPCIWIKSTSNGPFSSDLEQKPVQTLGIYTKLIARKFYENLMSQFRDIRARSRCSEIAENPDDLKCLRCSAQLQQPSAPPSASKSLVMDPNIIYDTIGDHPDPFHGFGSIPQFWNSPYFSGENR